MQVRSIASRSGPPSPSPQMAPSGTRLYAKSPSGFEPVFFAKGASKLFALCPATAAAGTPSRSRGAILAVACTIPRVLDGKKGPSPPSLEPRCRPHLCPAPTTLLAFPTAVSIPLRFWTPGCLGAPPGCSQAAQGQVPRGGRGDTGHRPRRITRPPMRPGSFAAVTWGLRSTGALSR